MITKQLSTLLAIGAALLPAHAEVQMHMERASIFKNGYSCVQMLGTMDDGEIQHIKGMPAPVLGTFRWQAPVEITRLQAHDEQRRVPVSTFGNVELLRANYGKIATVEFSGGISYQGVIHPATPAPAPAAASYISPKLPAPSETPGANTTFFRLVTSDGSSLVLDARDIHTLSISGSAAPQLPTRSATVRDLGVCLSSPARGAELRLSCLTGGLSWLPMYTLELDTAEGEATLTCKAMIINDLVDMNDVQVDLVTDLPLSSDNSQQSPLSSKQHLEQFLAELGEQAQGESPAPTNGIHTGSLSLSRHADSAPALPSLASAAPSGHALPHFSCKRGDTVVRTLFRQTVPYKHIYTCNVPDQNTLRRSSRQALSTVCPVWHSLQLTNTGDSTWSSGTISCYAADHLIARSSLDTISTGQQTILRLNKTFDLSLDCRETLIRQGNKSSKVDSNDRSNIYQGALELRNLSDRPMELLLTKDIEGIPTKMSHNATSHSLPVYNGNPYSTITWRLNLAPGASVTCSYTYEYDD